MIVMTSMRRTVATAFTAVAAVIGVTACETDRASVLEPVGDPAFNFTLSPRSAATAALPGGTIALTQAAAAADNKAVITLRNLEPMTGAVYMVWLGTEASSAAADFAPATGTLRIITNKPTDATLRDTVVSEGVSSFNGVNDPTARYELTVTAASAGFDPVVGPRNVALVTIESSGGATAPAASPRPLWARFTPRTTAGTTNANFLFGNYDPDVTKQYVFPLVGRGIAAVRTNTIIVDDSGIGRPPRGYYYAAYLIGIDAETGAATDTIPLGELTAPYPRETVSLRDADIETVDPVVTDRPYSIYASALRYEGPATMRFVGYPNLVIALKNKRSAAEVAPPNAVLGGTLPENVVTPPEEEEESE